VNANTVNSFCVDNNSVFYDQIRDVLPYDFAFVNYIERCLLLKRNSTKSELNRECVLVRLFEQSMPMESEPPSHTQRSDKPLLSTAIRVYWCPFVVRISIGLSTGQETTTIQKKNPLRQRGRRGLGCLNLRVGRRGQFLAALCPVYDRKVVRISRTTL
jgi:hypothetical protein